MRKIAFIIGILGLGLLISFLIVEPLEVEDLQEVAIGEIVVVKGLVEEERNFGGGKLMMLEDIPVFCECSLSYVGKNVEVEGIIERFPKDFRVKAYRIKSLD